MPAWPALFCTYSQEFHYFARIGVVSTHAYFKEHHPYTLGIVAIGGIIWMITRLINYVERDRHNG